MNAIHSDPIATKPIHSMRFISFDADTEEARVAILFKAGAKSDGVNGYTTLLVVQQEKHARAIVRRFNAAARAERAARAAA